MTWAGIFLILFSIAIGILGLALLVTVVTTVFLALRRRGANLPGEDQATTSAG